MPVTKCKKHQDLILNEEADLTCIIGTWLDEAGVINLTQLCPPCFLRGMEVGSPWFHLLSVYQVWVYASEGRNWDKFGSLLDVPPTSLPNLPLPEPAYLILGKQVETPRLMILYDFNIYAKMKLSGVVQEFMMLMTTMGLFHVITGPTCLARHTLVLVCYSVGQGDLEVEELMFAPLP